MLSTEHQKWLEARAIDVETATRLGIYTDTGRSNGRALAFPYFRDGKLIKTKYRLPDKRFYVEPTDANHAFWNEDILRDGSLAEYPVVVTEGELDAIAVIQSGHQRTVSVDGGANSNLDFMGTAIKELMGPKNRYIVCGDKDEAGAKFNAEFARRIGPARCYWPDYPVGKDFNDVLMGAGGSEVVMAVLRLSKPFPIKGLYRFSDYPDEPEPELFKSGFISLNPYLNMWPGEFMVITGIPQYGKSRFAIELAASMNQQHGQKAVIASFEMRIKPYVQQILREHHCGRWMQYMSPEEKKAADDWMEENFRIIDQNPRDIEEDADHEWMIERAKDAVIQDGVKNWILDPWNQVEHKRKRWETTADYQCRAIRDIKRFSRSFTCSTWIVVHPTKDVKQKDGSVRKPTIYDVDGSSHWNNAADHAIVVHGDLATNIREIDVQKIRYRTAGKLGAGYLKLENGRLGSTAYGTPQDNVQAEQASVH